MDYGQMPNLPINESEREMSTKPQGQFTSLQPPQEGFSSMQIPVQNPQFNPNVNPNSFNPNPQGDPREMMHQDFPERLDLTCPAFEALADATKAIVKQEIELMEIITGFETKNRYKVYVKNEIDKKKKKIFKCKEESGCCERNCCPGSARGFKMKIKYLSQEEEDDDYTSYVAKLDRPFKCTCLCLARPKMDAFWFEPQQYLGNVYEPFSCCNVLMNINDNNNEVKYTINASCCQCGICCRTGFGKCCEVKFPIFQACNQNQEEGFEDGVIIKKLKSVITEMVSDADYFEIEFPKNATPQDKFMIISATLMIDYRYYEESPGDNKNHHHDY